MGILLGWIVQKHWLTLTAFLLLLLGFFTLLGPRLRLAWVLWMGFSTGVLMAGILLGGSNQAVFVASVAAFAVLTMPSIIAMGLIHGRRVREEQSSAPIL
jgi:hypothetical protein